MLEKLLNKLFQKKEILRCSHEVYLVRWYVLRTKWLGCFIHKFVRSDEDSALHDHPWPFLVIPLWRGYHEVNDRGTSNVLPLLGTRLRPAEYRHRVALRDGKPSWSLFFRFRKTREWGFWPKAGFIKWNEWWKTNKCE